MSHTPPDPSMASSSQSHTLRHQNRVGALPFPSLLSIYKPSSISISLVLSKTGRTGIHYIKMVKGDNSINIQARSMVLGLCPSPHCHLSINKVMVKGDNSINIQARSMVLGLCPSPHCHLSLNKV